MVFFTTFYPLQATSTQPRDAYKVITDAIFQLKSKKLNYLDQFNALKTFILRKEQELLMIKIEYKNFEEKQPLLKPQIDMLLKELIDSDIRIKNYWEKITKINNEINIAFEETQKSISTLRENLKIEQKNLKNELQRTIDKIKGFKKELKRNNNIKKTKDLIQVDWETENVSNKENWLMNNLNLLNYEKENLERRIEEIKLNSKIIRENIKLMQLTTLDDIKKHTQEKETEKRNYEDFLAEQQMYIKTKI